jgi:hypothetical protein
MYKICVYIPESHLQPVKEALLAAGAGRIGHYDSCCWQVLGEGQFRALEGSDPFIGQVVKGQKGKIETVKEYKVELVCEDTLIKQAIAAMKQAHPYETPAYDVWKLEDF